jgi:hypothetical protein
MQAIQVNTAVQTTAAAIIKATENIEAKKHLNTEVNLRLNRMNTQKQKKTLKYLHQNTSWGALELTTIQIKQLQSKSISQKTIKKQADGQKQTKKSMERNC